MEKVFIISESEPLRRGGGGGGGYIKIHRICLLSIILANSDLCLAMN